MPARDTLTGSGASRYPCPPPTRTDRTPRQVSDGSIGEVDADDGTVPQRLSTSAEDGNSPSSTTTPIPLRLPPSRPSSGESGSASVDAECRRSSWSIGGVCPNCGGRPWANETRSTAHDICGSCLSQVDEADEAFSTRRRGKEAGEAIFMMRTGVKNRINLLSNYDPLYYLAVTEK